MARRARAYAVLARVPPDQALAGAPMTTVSRPPDTAGAAAPGQPVAARLRAQLRDPLQTNVYALTLNTAVTSVLGIGYWVLAARLYAPRELGIGAAIVSTMTLLSNLSQLNLNGTLARFLPTAGQHGGRLVASAYGASCGVALVLGTGFLLIAPALSPSVAVVTASPLLAVAFVLSIAAWGVFTLQDSVLTALRGAVWVPVENAAFGIAKIALLVSLATALPTLGIFASWNLPVVATLVAVNVLVFRRLLPRPQRRQATELPGRALLVRFVMLDYVGYLFLQAGTNALPVLVASVLGATANAVFYVGWLLGSSIELVAYHFGTSLTVESAANPARLAAYTRQVLRRGLLVFAPVAALLCLFAPVLLQVFGTQYAQDSATVLRLFAVAALPKFVVTVFIATCRVQRRVGRIVLIQAGTSAFVVSFGVLSMHSMGAAGVGVGYLAGQLVVAAAVLPALTRLLRTRA
ncbi:MAG TPA: hypothetical protein VFC00_35760 [Micromonosporaceae bacterium]|nr:hypothetical protein [Micromonosporaceae bacterium]